jgi:hypothetical protein
VQVAIAGVVLLVGLISSSSENRARREAAAVNGRAMASGVWAQGRWYCDNGLMFTLGPRGGTFDWQMGGSKTIGGKNSVIASTPGIASYTNYDKYGQRTGEESVNFLDVSMDGEWGWNPAGGNNTRFILATDGSAVHFVPGSSYDACMPGRDPLGCLNKVRSDGRPIRYICSRRPN